MSNPETIAPSHDPSRQIARGNPWYTVDQFAAHFGNASYRAGVERRWDVTERLAAEWIEQAGTKSFTILDAGCGDGINLLGLLNAIRSRGWGARLHGLDYNPLRLERAKSLSGEVRLQRASLLELPFGDDAFDIILCSQVLEHISDDRSAMGELKRVLKPGGLLILAVPNEGCLMAKIRNYVLQPSIRQRTDHVNFYTAGELKRRLFTAGIDIVSFAPEGFFFPHLRLHVWIGARPWGRKLSSTLTKLLPSQTAGLFAACRHGIAP